MEQDEHADVLVIGAGPAGAAFAWRLSEAGLNIVCLEQGRWGRPRVSIGRRDDREPLEPPGWSHDPNVRRRAEDYPVDSSESAIAPLMHSGVGGTSIHWSGLCERLHPSDFRARTLDDVADDWPLTYRELEPYYDLNDEMMGCAGIEGDPANPARAAGKRPPPPLGRDGLILAEAFDRLGWHWWPADSFVAGAPHGEKPGEGHSRTSTGAGADAVYWPLAARNGAKLRTRCRAVEITTGGDGRVSGAAYRDHEGEVRHQPAGAVALACNAIGTPRLLLASASDRHPHGLANSSGLVGKNLMLHPSGMAVGLFEDDLESGGHSPGSVLVSQEFYETDPRRAFARGYALHMT